MLSKPISFPESKKINKINSIIRNIQLHLWNSANIYSILLIVFCIMAGLLFSREAAFFAFFAPLANIWAFYAYNNKK